MEQGSTSDNWLSRLTGRQRQMLAVGGLAALVVLVIVLVASGGDEADRDVDILALERATVLVQMLDDTGEVTGIGSGSIISRDGLILTNAHVAAPASPGQGLYIGEPNEAEDPAGLLIGVFKAEDEPVEDKYFAKVVAVDGYVDAAVLRIDRNADGSPLSPDELNLPTVPLGDSNSLRNGDDMTIVGFPGIGGGFEGAIDVLDGKVAGFEQDDRITERRGWVKTTAEISGGNSGGLAADDDGRLIGIPSVTRPSARDFTSKSALRPLALAMPVIRAAREGADYASPYFVPGTGAERAELVGWASSPPEPGCGFQRVQAYPSGARRLTAVLDVDGLARKEDLQYVWIYLKDENDEPQRIGVVGDVWRSGTGGSNCFAVSFPGQGSEELPDGVFVLSVQAGPNLKELAFEVVSVGGGGAAEGARPQGPGNQPAQPQQPPVTQPGADPGSCRNWTPANVVGTGVDLSPVVLQNGETLAEGGMAQLSETIGDPNGFSTLAEADQAAAARMSVDLFGTKSFRWVVLQHRGRFYSFVAKHEEVTDILQPPCRIQPADGTLVAWHALRFLGPAGSMRWYAYDWSQGTGRIRVFQ